MNYNIENNICDIENKKLQTEINKILSLYTKETQKENKVAFYYENIETGNTISYNKEKTFYAASTIKILVCLMILEKKLINLNKKILITKKDLKQDTGIIKYQKEDTYYTIKELIELTIVESDNTAYLKLVELIGKNKIKEYGNSLGAKYTMEGKETDSFGIINCEDMIIYWKKVREYIESNQEYSQFFKKILQNPTVKFIKDKSIDNNIFIRKYGSWDIAYHEAGYVEGNNPYYIIILTQLNKKKYKEKFINKSAKIINNINKIILQK